MQRTLSGSRTLGRSFGFVRVGAATFWCKPMGIAENLKHHIDLARRADQEGVQVLGFPELSLTGYGCRNAFRQRELQIAAREALMDFCQATQDLRTVFVVGLPLVLNDVFNVAAVVYRGTVGAFIPKSFLAARSEWQEDEWFAPASRLQTDTVELPGQESLIPIGTDLLVPIEDEEGNLVCTLGVEICADGWQPNSPGDRHALNGANVIVNLSASNWTLGKDKWRQTLFPANSGRQKSAYVYVTMSGDSTSSVVWDGQCMILEDGNVLATTKRWTKPWEEQLITADVDVGRLENDRRSDGEWAEAQRLATVPYLCRTFCKAPAWQPNPDDFRRPLPRLPFVPKDPAVMKSVGEELFEGLGQGLMGRLWHLGNGQPVPVFMGWSGGRDSLLTLLIAYDQFLSYGWDPSVYLHAVRAPGPGSSDRTQNNSLALVRAMNCATSTVDITSIATEALRAAGHEPCWHCLQCENAQARARTYIFKTMGFNLGTGDMSEAAKGWCTEGGDQSSHWHVIANIPKTLVEYLIRYYIEYKTNNEELKRIILDILDTIVSPELVKVAPGEEIQSSEDKMGPYALTDFFLYHFLRTNATPERIAFLAETAFGKKDKDTDVIYDRATILKWLRDFYVKFNFAQFKRNASPDSSLVGTIGLGAHDKCRWPTDGSVQPWLDAVDRMIAELS